MRLQSTRLLFALAVALGMALSTTSRVWAHGAVTVRADGDYGPYHVVVVTNSGLDGPAAVAGRRRRGPLRYLRLLLPASVFAPPSDTQSRLRRFGKGSRGLATPGPAETARTGGRRVPPNFGLWILD